MCSDALLLPAYRGSFFAFEIRFQSYSEAYDDDFEDIRRRVPDLGRLKATIGYSPTYDLPQIVRDVHQSQISVQNT